MSDEIAAAGAGWRVGQAPEAIAAGLREVFATDPDLLKRSGANARDLALREYNWPTIALRTVEAYRRYAAE
jgi:glycosyltransferase involved in cell wall biosynthesis